MLFVLVFRYGAVALEKFLRVLQQLPCAVVSDVGAGHGLAHCYSSFLDLGTHACGTIWFESIKKSGRWVTTWVEKP